MEGVLVAKVLRTTEPGPLNAVSSVIRVEFWRTGACRRQGRMASWATPLRWNGSTSDSLEQERSGVGGGEKKVL